jgi:hypothetical protein
MNLTVRKNAVDSQAAVAGKGGEAMKCDACKKPIGGDYSQHKSMPVTGSMLKGIKTVRVCASCCAEQDAITAQSRKRHAAELVATIEAMIAENPAWAATLGPHLETWKAQAEGEGR